MESPYVARMVEEKGDRHCSTTVTRYSCRVQITKIAIERNERKRMLFLHRISRFRPEQMQFVDETSMDAKLPYRNYGWAPSGDRVVLPARFVRGKR